MSQAPGSPNANPSLSMPPAMKRWSLFTFGGVAFLILFMTASPSLAQTAEFTQGSKGSNTVSIEVPLGNYPGRGVSLPVTLRYSSSGLWRIGFINSVQVNAQNVSCSVAEAIYGEHSTAGWKTSLDVPTIEWPRLNDRYWADGKPYAKGMVSGYTYRIARLWIHMPDGSTHELRKADQVYADNNSIDMTGDFYAVDGSRMRYNSTGQTTGTLYLADGSRYKFVSTNVTEYVDPNGNTLTYNAQNRQWADTMGRVFNLPWPVNPGATDYTYSLPGINNSPITYTLKFRLLQDALTPGSPARLPISDHNLPTPGAEPTGYAGGNFPQATGGSTMFASANSDTNEPPDPRSFTYVVGRGQSGATTFNPVVLTEIDLPNGQSYRFSYNNYGELDKVEYPTGGYQRYQYGNVATIGGAEVPYNQGTRGMASRWLSPSGSGSDEAQWLYSVAPSGSPVGVTAPNGTYSETYLYNSSSYLNFGYHDAKNGLPIDERIYASQGGAMVRRTLIEYEQTSAAISKPVQQYYPGTYTAYRNARTKKTVSLILDTGGNALTSTTTTAYQSNSFEFSVGLDATSSSEFAYTTVDQTTAQNGAISSIPTGSLVRSTQTAYLTSDANYRDRNIPGLPTSTIVYNASGVMVAQSVVSYDEASYPLLTYGSVTGWYDPQTTYRGNPTTTSRWLDLPTQTWITTHAQYDQCGSVRKVWDARDTSLLNPSQIEYSSTYHYAYPTQTSSSVPDSSGAHGSTTSLVATRVYDFQTGLVTSTTDANNKTATFEYNDSLTRPTKVNRPDGGWTSTGYSDTPGNLYVHTQTLQQSTPTQQTIDGYAYFDGLGRSARSFAYDGTPSTPWLVADTYYDLMGRISKVSNPYRVGSLSAIVPSSCSACSETEYDSLGRAFRVTTPDGAQINTAYSASTTGSYLGPTVTVTDQALKKRMSVSDAQGRLIQVIEDPTGVGYQTNYTYDVLNNLRKVDQGGQVRYFFYDSLSRVLRVRNVEQTVNGALNWTDPVTGYAGGWTAGFTYDANGNLITRTDARNITTNFAYDALNRAYSRTYSDGTPAATLNYDSATNGKGRLTSVVTSGISTLTYGGYDTMGRVTSGSQTIGSQTYSMSYGYDLAGHVKSMTYPSGHVVNYAFDPAGRINNFTGNLGDGVPRTYSTGISYSAFGGIQQEQFGTQTPLYDKRHYNVRGQLYDTRLSTYSLQGSEWDWDRGALVNYYSSNYSWGGSGTDNNGNVVRQETYVPGSSWFQQNYSYDSLNRLKSVTEKLNGSGADSFKQAYTIDQWGNRTIDATDTSANLPRPGFTVNTGTNQLNAPAGYSYSYDAAGNQYSDTYGDNLGVSYARVYDAENHMTTSTATYSNPYQVVTSDYTYDGNGRRIKRNIGGTETWQVYGLGGELLAEYKSGAATFLPTKEYGYRGGELLVTMASGDDARLARFVTNLYYGALQRDPTPTELQNGINALAAAGAQGQSQLLAAATSLARSLFTQTAYETSPYRDDAQYVTDVYYAYTQRGPDTGGLNFWVGQLVYGRAHICNGFEASGEFQTLVASLYGTATSDNQRTDQIVNNFYLAASGVNATPTQLQAQRDVLNAAAVQGVTQVQAALESFGRGLFAAQVNDGSITNQQFVTNLYEGFLQRGPDAGGLGFWSSGSKQWALDGMATSIAFRELAATLYREAFWLVNDHLGTLRMVVDKSGTLAGIKRHDYLPFGEEIYAGLGGRTTGQGYVGDSVRQHFTGYERDGESGLNFAQARYQSSVQGRFTSVDPLGSSATIADPQSFNRYSYVQNNPTNFTDPTGMALSDIGVTQTEDAEFAKTLQRKSDSDFRRAINGDYATRHGSTVSYDKRGGGKLVPGIRVVGVVTIHGHFEDILGNPDFMAMQKALWAYAASGPHRIFTFGGPVQQTVTGTPRVNDSPSQSGYLDLNGSYGTPYWVGPTGGVMIDNQGTVAPYIGFGIMNPLHSGTAQYSPDSISGGLNVQLQGSAYLSGAIGLDEAGNVFYEGGGGTPGFSLTMFYVFNAPHPYSPPLAGRRNAAINGSGPARTSSRNCACNVP